MGTLSMIGILCASSLLLALLFWPEGKAALQQWLLPGDEAVTAAAMEDMVLSLKNGDPVMESLKQFCRHIWEGAALAEY